MNHEELRQIHADPSYTHQEKVEASIRAFQHYMNTYTLGTCCNGLGNVFADDVLYMLGVALDPSEHTYANGYNEFKDKLLTKLLNPRNRLIFSSEEK